jgi:hypothetical protein
MDDGLARQAGAFGALLTLLLRSGGDLPSPAMLATAGTLGLTLYGLIAIGQPVLRRLLEPPPHREPPPAPPDA